MQSKGRCTIPPNRFKVSFLLGPNFLLPLTILSDQRIGYHTQDLCPLPETIQKCSIDNDGLGHEVPRNQPLGGLGQSTHLNSLVQSYYWTWRSECVLGIFSPALWSSTAGHTVFCRLLAAAHNDLKKSDKLRAYHPTQVLFSSNTVGAR